MAVAFVIKVKGVTPQEINKNLQIIDSYMNQKQEILKLVSDVKNNPRVYYSEDNIVPKTIHDVVYDLRMDKAITHAIKSIHYHGSLMKV